MEFTLPNVLAGVTAFSGVLGAQRAMNPGAIVVGSTASPVDQLSTIQEYIQGGNTLVVGSVLTAAAGTYFARKKRPEARYWFMGILAVGLIPLVFSYMDSTNASKTSALAVYAFTAAVASGVTYFWPSEA